MDKLLTIRWMLRNDLPEILNIEEFNAVPWDEEDFLIHLKKRNSVGIVAEIDNKIVGYMIYEFGRKLFHVLNITVHKNYRRNGVASQIISKLSSKKKNIEFVVNERSLELQLFLKKNGFKAVEIINKYFEKNSDDAYIMAIKGEKYEQNRVCLLG
jgi:ribosomal-protein-alanine N-acetyltransferase